MNKATFALFLIFVGAFDSYSQQPLSVEGGIPVQTLVEEFVGGTGVQIFNVQSNAGQPKQFGSFSNGTSYFGFEDGLVLATFGVEREFSYEEDLTSPNTGTAQFQGDGGLANIDDPDVEALLGGFGGHRNMAQLEFDFIPEGSSLDFTFVFASEEYTDFVGSAFNDQFAMILTGPGFDHVNIAKLPNGQVISINSVNQNQNSDYYINNEFLDGFDGDPFPMDGRTSAIDVHVDLECNATYHFKILILNRQDPVRGSAVFWKKGSLASITAIDQIVAVPDPVCEGQPITLSIDGPQEFTYTWNNGSSGVGLTEVTTLASLGTVYSVQAYGAENPECIIYRSITPRVHPLNNIPPYTTGINGTGGYTAYVQAGQELCFNVQTGDNPDETVTIDEEALNDVKPEGMIVSIVGQSQESVELCWQTTVDDFGVYTFDMDYVDNNACGAMDNTDQITVHVLCPNCPQVITYDDRTPANNPLPAVTRAGEAIKVGINGPVTPGNAEVLFQAGSFIAYGDFWDSGPNFTGEIVPVCVSEEDCAGCCDDFTAFTFDTPISNAFSPDGDGCNDVWFVSDVQHANCAFNAMGYLLEVRTPAGVLVYRAEESHQYCCPFSSPDGIVPCPALQAPSSIQWDGICNQQGIGGGLGYGCYVNDGTYFYVLEFTVGHAELSCSHTDGVTGFITVLNSLGPGDCGHLNRIADPEGVDGMLAQREPATTPIPLDETGCRLTFGYSAKQEEASVSITGEGRIQRIELFCPDGRLIHVKEHCGTGCAVQMAGMAPGVYLLRAITENGPQTFRFAKP